MSNLSCATLNLCNFGEWQPPYKIDKLIHLIISDLETPDLIAVQEIGGLALASEQPVNATVAQEICQKLNLQLSDSAISYNYIDIPPLPNSTGGESPFNIRCGFFYKSIITVKQITPIGLNHPAFKGEELSGFQASRPPLALNCIIYGIEFWIINCHLKSMSGAKQTKKLFKKQRNEQTEVIVDFIKNKISSKLPVIVLGDMNDLPGSKTIQTFLQQGFDSVLFHLETSNIYTYRHGTKPIVLDYIFYNANFKLDHAKILHVHADFYSQPRLSDHDPIFAHFYFN